jgi:signal transduction histidine kinase/CheY-like chemotaxis protein
MRRALAGWFTDAPILDPIERRLAPLLIAVLTLTPLAAMQAALVLATSPMHEGATLVRVGVNTLIGLGGVSGLVLVKRGHFKLAVVVTAYAFMFAFAMGNICLGLYEHRSQLAQWAIPLAFLGLLLERRWLIGAVVLALGSTLIAAMLDPGLFPPPPRSASGNLALVVGSFVCLVLFLAVLFDRFSVTMRRTLAAALARERELEDVRQSLEARTTDLVRINDEMQREMAERRRLESELVHAQKMDSIGRLAGGVAHDFNNLLTVIVGYAEALRTTLPAGTHGHDDATEILHASTRAADLTRQLLAFARRQTMETREVDANELVSQADRLLRRLIGDEVEIETQLADEPMFMRVDPSQIQQVLINLAVNARDAMPDGGRLTIVVDEDASGETPCVRITVSDTGVGIEPELLPHVFEPFFTTKDVGRGTGLGLPTCFGIVAQHGGRILLESELGRGTTVRVLLPRFVAPAQAAEAKAAPRSDILPKGQEAILLVEDESRVRALAAQVLRAQGYHVVEAADGDEAVGAAAAHDPGELHLLVTDMLMPRMRGSEVAARVRLAHPQIKVLFISGYADLSGLAPRIDETTVPFLAKPFTPASLAHRVREVLDTAVLRR